MRTFFSLVILLCMTFLIQSCDFGKRLSKKGLTVDQLTEQIGKKFKDISFDNEAIEEDLDGNFLLDNVSPNTAPYLVGKLFFTEIGPDGKKKMYSLDGKNLLKKDAEVKNDLAFKDPFFDKYLKGGFTTNINAVEKARGKISSEQSAHFIYSPVYHSVATGDYIDKIELAEIKKLYTENTRPGITFHVVYSVSVNKLTYDIYRKFEGEINASSPIISFEGSAYYKEGESSNTYEVIVGTDILDTGIFTNPNKSIEEMTTDNLKNNEIDRPESIEIFSLNNISSF